MVREEAIVLNLDGQSCRTHQRCRKVAMPTHVLEASQISSSSSTLRPVSWAGIRRIRSGTRPRSCPSTDYLSELPLEARTARNWRYFYYREELEEALEPYMNLSLSAGEEETRRRYEDDMA